MWNGKWNKELDTLYELYYNIFEIEPDCDMDIDIDFDTVSYNTFRDAIKRSIISKSRITL